MENIIGEVSHIGSEAKNLIYLTVGTEGGGREAERTTQIV